MAATSFNAHRVFASIPTTTTVTDNVFVVIGFTMAKRIVPMDPMKVSGYYNILKIVSFLSRSNQLKV